MAQYKLVITGLIILLFPILMRLSIHLLTQLTRGKIDMHRQQRAKLLLRVIVAVLLVCLLLMFWGIELKGLLVLGSSLFAMLGVALFAGWSLLSNLTSFLILFIQNDCRIGFWVRVIDGSNFVEGRISEMGLMNVILEHIDGHKVIYPNNIFVTRPVMILCKAPNKRSSLPEKRLLRPKKSR
ncbi:mechanosensitive ion channel domain-containing protein [Pseudoalteromonas sp. MMG005]|uniref:mechanosensitive ion channel domain-containing protein n=1 Tax=Pseudoalteromonas sp. MMG005 TaxID=2822682 RepID=UPI001FFCE507|nr:mechanosensitive ion channel domain-containing protein [Pseudoalteromonas sp. MMG005]